MAEETLTVSFNDRASAPAGIAAAALDRVDAALSKVEGREVDLKTGKLSEAAQALNRLRDLAGRAGSAMAMALNGVSPAAAGASAAGTKLSSVFDLLKKRADAFKAAESAAFAEMERRANRTPTALQAGAAPKAQTGFQQLLAVTDKLFGAKAAGALSSGATSLVEAADKLGPAGPMLLQGGKLLAVGALAVGVAAAALVAAAAVVAYKLLEAGMKLAIAQTSIREGFEGSIAKMVGGAQAAKDIFNSAIKLAVQLGLDKDVVLAKAKELVGVGFRGAEVDMILRVRADVAKGGSEERANAFQKYLEKLKSGKAFTSIDELAEAGISADRVLASLSEKLGVKIDRVKELLKAGKIDVQTGIQAVLAAAQGQYGGSAAGTATVETKLAGLKTLFESMFDSVDLSGIKSALDSVKKLFEGPDGEKFKAAVNKLFGTISDIFGKAFSGKEGEARLQRFITGITKLMEGAASVIESAGPRIIQVIDGISKIVDRNGSGTGGSWLQSLILGIAELSAALGAADITGELQALFSAFDSVQPYVDKLFQLGSDLISGLIRGMIAGGDPATVLTGIVARAVAGAAGPKGADAHSPSRKTTQLGVWMGQGLVGGMDRMAALVGNAGQTMVGAALGAANDNGIPAAASMGGAAAASGGGVTINVHVTAGAGTTREQAQAAGEAAGEGAYQAWTRHMGRFVRDGRRAA